MRLSSNITKFYLLQEGYSAEAFRRSPDRLRRPASADSSLMLRSMSTDDEFYDPG
ncbi:unnamed protein product [Cylicostephanus goldi]|uniref:Uncharacterized protein n=1 Tax=Cylicostephanus goldi TaxID=71465 RepID=A0A3P7MKI0_CYLGO|nr:unnamed protein product [Cylicostephanus goldi]